MHESVNKIYEENQQERVLIDIQRIKENKIKRRAGRKGKIWQLEENEEKKLNVFARQREKCFMIYRKWRKCKTRVKELNEN